MKPLLLSSLALLLLSGALAAAGTGRIGGDGTTGELFTGTVVVLAVVAAVALGMSVRVLR